MAFGTGLGLSQGTVQPFAETVSRVHSRALERPQAGEVAQSRAEFSWYLWLVRRIYHDTANTQELSLGLQLPSMVLASC